MKWKYRIAQKGDLYKAQLRAGWLESWKGARWTSKEDACRTVAMWKKDDLDNSMPITYHKPEDICVKCKESE